MNQENKFSELGEPAMRVTRARAKALLQSGELPPLHPSSKQDKGLAHHFTLKRAASDVNQTATSGPACHPNKKRAVLGDVTNIDWKKSCMKGIDVAKVQKRRGCTKSKEKVTPVAFGGKPCLKEKINESINVSGSEKSEEEYFLENPMLVLQPNESIGSKECGMENIMHMKLSSCKYAGLQRQAQIGVISLQEQKGSDNHCIIDIDEQKDPLMCGLYAPDIYRTMRAMELGRRPSADYMEKLQNDITHSMRGILIDWLVEVSEEYRLVPDTLYLTVNLIDRFLAANYIEKQKLQLLGVTCMLIASKYEEIIAPRVEEFCFITDNTYAKEEVVRTENRVLNCLEFQLSVPTTKKFLRRFIQAAQVSYKVPSVQLEFLANYLAELTLLEYSFVKLLPSIIAAAVVFLARWTLDQSDHPWTPTLEHYTSYKTHELKAAVLALRELQLDSANSRLNSIREKYTHSKFHNVASLSSPNINEELFAQEPLGL